MINAKVQLRVNLEGEWADKFNEIKDFHGLKNSSEVVRVLITEHHRKIKKELGETLDEHSP